eukprot:355149-Chlamydomonas_euryale.AAC.1
MVPASSSACERLCPALLPSLLPRRKNCRLYRSAVPRQESYVCQPAPLGSPQRPAGREPFPAFKTPKKDLCPHHVHESLLVLSLVAGNAPGALIRRSLPICRAQRRPHN